MKFEPCGFLEHVNVHQDQTTSTMEQVSLLPWHVLLFCYASWVETISFQDLWSVTTGSPVDFRSCCEARRTIKRHPFCRRLRSLHRSLKRSVAANVPCPKILVVKEGDALGWLRLRRRSSAVPGMSKMFALGTNHARKTDLELNLRLFTQRRFHWMVWNMNHLMWRAVVFVKMPPKPPKCTGCSQLAQCELVDDHREEKLLQVGRRHPQTNFGMLVMLVKTRLVE